MPIVDSRLERNIKIYHGPMKLFYTYEVFYAQKYGGISRYYYELIRRIPPGIADVKVLAGLYINEYIKALPMVRGMKVPQLRYTGIIRKLANRIFRKIILRNTGSYSND